MLEVNQPAPEFTAVNQDDETISLKQYRGKKNVVLYLYPKDDTPGCTIEANEFTALIDDFNAADTVVLGVSKDSLKSHDKFITDFNLPFVLLSDPETTMMAKYGAWGEKVLYGKTSIGCIRSTVILDEKGKIIKHWRKVPKAEAHPAKVLEYLQSL